jgi:predicted metal-dependent hydrolase
MDKNNILNSVKIIKSNRSRNLRISISPDKQVTLTIPRRISEGEGIRFLNSRVDWIEKTLSKIKPRVKGKWEWKFLDASQIFFFGLPHRLQFSTDSMYPYINKVKSSKLKVQSLNMIKDNSVIPAKAGILNQTDSFFEIITPGKKKTFDNFLSNKLREHIYSFAYKFCKENGFKFNELRIKNVVSRWGSCSRKGNLNFSIRLVHYEKEIINYVVIHELCHTKEMNHSRKFWALVARYCPEYKTHIKMLK